MPKTYRRAAPPTSREAEADLTPWLEQARRELELLRQSREADSWEDDLLSILGDILSTAEDAIGSFRINNWERLFAFLERIQDKAQQGIEQLNTRV
jgi:hypothetical protein